MALKVELDMIDQRLQIKLKKLRDEVSSSLKFKDIMLKRYDNIIVYKDCYFLNMRFKLLVSKET